MTSGQEVNLMFCHKCKSWELVKDMKCSDCFKKELEKQSKKILKKVIWLISQDEGGHILHYNDWINDNWERLRR